MTTSTLTFELRVRNIPGVLVRIAHVFARRGYNITSLRVDPVEGTHWSTMTIVTRDAPRIREVAAHLEKLIDVDSVETK